jgi:starch-binding outer membrane protein, SusD/RagB family
MVVAPSYPLKNKAIQKWGGYKMTWKFYHTFERGDERLTRLIASYAGEDGLPYNEVLTGSESDLKLGVLPIKYEEDPASIGTNNQIDWIVYRYADVLLLLAEALNRQNGGPTDECFNLVNQVRSRAGLTDAYRTNQFIVTTVKGSVLRPVTITYDLTTMEGFNEFVLAERGHELWFEGCRRQDLIRHGKYFEAVKNKVGFREGMSSEGRNHYPIPSWIIREGKGLIIQNDPYK